MIRFADFPFFCLNLARRPDRRLQAWQQFRREGLLVEKEVAQDAMHETETRGWRNKGARACAVAHRLAWREARRAGAKGVVVFEDDAVLCRGFQERLKGLELPEDWTVVYFGCVFRTRPEIVTQGLRPAVSQSVPAAGVGGGEEQAGGTAERQPGRAALPRLPQRHPQPASAAETAAPPSRYIPSPLPQCSSPRGSSPPLSSLLRHNFFLPRNSDDPLFGVQTAPPKLFFKIFAKVIDALTQS